MGSFDLKGFLNAIKRLYNWINAFVKVSDDVSEWFELIARVPPSCTVSMRLDKIAGGNHRKVHGT